MSETWPPTRPVNSRASWDLRGELHGVFVNRCPGVRAQVRQQASSARCCRVDSRSGPLVGRQVGHRGTRIPPVLRGRLVVAPRCFGLLCAQGVATFHALEERNILEAVALDLQPDAGNRARYSKPFAGIDQSRFAALEMKPGVSAGVDGEPVHEAVHAPEPRLKGNLVIAELGSVTLGGPE